MSLYQWEREYEQLLDKHLDQGKAGREDGSELRRHPRLKIDKEAIWVNVDARCQVLDCSVSGIAFYSSHLFKRACAKSS